MGDGDDVSEVQTCVFGAAPDHARPSSYGGISSSAAGDDDVIMTHPAGGGMSHHSVMAAGPGPGSLAVAAAGAAGDSAWRMTHSSQGMSHSGGALAREEALVAFRAGPGAGHAKLVNDNHARLRAAKKRRQVVAEQLNGLKAQVGRLP